MTIDGDRELLDRLRNPHNVNYDLTRSACDRIEELLRIVADNEARIAQLSGDMQAMTERHMHDHAMAVRAADREASLRATIDTVRQLTRTAYRLAKDIA